jgi:hypothetical protein
MAEAPNHVVEKLEMAVAAVEAAKVPQDLREVAFKAALGAVGIVSIEKERSPIPEPSSSRSGDAGQGSADHRGPVAAIASKLKRDFNTVEQVFDIDDEGVHLLAGRGNLNEVQATAQQEVALLVLAGWQGAGKEEWTKISRVRDAANDLGVMDGAFASRIEKMRGPVRMKGDARNRELKLNSPGFEAAADLIDRITKPDQ